MLFSQARQETQRTSEKTKGRATFSKLKAVNASSCAAFPASFSDAFTGQSTSPAAGPSPGLGCGGRCSRIPARRPA